VTHHEASGVDEAAAIALDGTRLVVSGFVTRAGGGTDAWVRVLETADGTEDWTETYDSGANDKAFGVAFGTGGEVLATGFSRTAASGQDLLVLQYGSAGGLDWAITQDGATHSDDRGQAIAIDGSGAIYLAGMETGADTDVLVQKSDAAGAVQWSDRVDGDGVGVDEALGLALTPAGDVIVVGAVTVGAEGRNMWIREYAAP
jgi:hypothetical protein